MRPVAIALVILVGSCLAYDIAQAQPANTCNQCRDQQRACLSNYPAKTCKTEYDICIKGCRQK